MKREAKYRCSRKALQKSSVKKLNRMFRNNKSIEEMFSYVDSIVLNDLDSKGCEHAYELIRLIMERLDLTLHPTKTRIEGLWTGDEGFDFLGMHHRKTKAETSQGKVYYTTQQWLT